MKRKNMFFRTAAALLSLALLCAPVSAAENGFAAKTNDFSKGHSEYSLFDIAVSIPDSWEYTLNNDLGRHEFNAPSGAMMFVAQFSQNERFSDEVSRGIAEYYFADVFEIEDSFLDEYEGDDYYGFVEDLLLSDDSGEYAAACLVVGGQGCAWLIGCVAPEDVDVDRDLTRIFDSLSFPDTVLREAVPDAPAAPAAPVDSADAQINSADIVMVTLANGREVPVRRTVKEGLDAYEEFMATYTAALSSGDLTTYFSLLAQLAEMEAKIDQMEDDLTDEELLYYLEVTTRVVQNMY